MRKKAGIFCSIFMILLLILPPPVCFANDSSDIVEIPLKAPGTMSVTLVGQWTGGSKEKKDTTKIYSALEDPIGDPEVNGEPPLSLFKTFLGWSDKAPVGNGDLDEGARLFSPSDSIGSAFPDSIPNDAKLYAVYYSVNKPETAAISKGIRLLANYVKNLSNELNQNSVVINSQITGEDTLPNTTNATETVNEKDRSIIDFYSPKADQEKPHELVLEAEFRMNPKIAMLVYKNPICYDKKVPKTPERPILSRNYTDHYYKDDFSTQSGEEAGYTYMDLVLTLDKDLKLPERLCLQFDSYSWRPLFVLDADHKPMSVLKPSDGTDLGKTSGAFSNLVSPSASTRFDLSLTGANLTNTDGDHEICLRVVLRDGDKERIPENRNSINPLPGKSIAETIQQNMCLKILSSEDLKKNDPSLTPEDIAKRTITISDEKAKELAGTDGSKTLSVSGSLKGFLLSNTGEIQDGKRRNTHTGSVIVNTVTASPLRLGYQRQLGYFKETHIYNSYNQKNELINSEKSESTLQQGYSDANYSTAMRAKEGFSLTSVNSPNGAVYASNGEKKIGAFVEGATLEVTYIYEKIIEEPTTSSSTETTSQPTESEKPSDTEEIKPSEPSSTEESSTSESRPGASEQTPRVERGNWETSTPEAVKDYVSIRIAETEEARSSAQSANTEAKALPRTGEADLFLPFAALNLILGASLICYRKRKRITRH